MAAEEYLFKAIGENDEWAMRNFQWDKREPLHAGGGGAQPAAHGPTVLDSFTYLDDDLRGPVTAVQMTAPVDWIPVRKKECLMYNAVIIGISCNFWIEPDGGSPTQHYARCLPAVSALTVRSGEMISYNIGFETSGANTGMFFVDAIRYQEETTNLLPSQIVNQIKVETMRYTSMRVVLNATLISQYSLTGLRFFGQFKVYQ